MKQRNAINLIIFGFSSGPFFTVLWVVLAFITGWTPPGQEDPVAIRLIVTGVGILAWVTMLFGWIFGIVGIVKLVKANKSQS